MSSDKQIAANRTNGRKSRGPRTVAGKSASSRNALRHGLASISYNNPAFAPRIEGIARAICPDTSNPSLFEQALIIGETTCVLGCACAERIWRMERLLDGTASPAVDASLHRYERRALSRRNRAVQKFLEMIGPSSCRHAERQDGPHVCPALLRLR
jgi:hypothetical protein